MDDLLVELLTVAPDADLERIVGDHRDALMERPHVLWVAIERREQWARICDTADARLGHLLTVHRLREVWRSASGST